MAAKSIKSGKILAVEADPVSYNKLVKNINANNVEGIIEPVCVGVSDKKEILKLNIKTDGNRGENSFLIKTDAQVEVQCFALCQILMEHGINTVKGIKIDIEGFESKVLNAFFNYSKCYELWPSFLIIEYFPDSDATTGNPIDLVKSYGYRIVDKSSYNYIMLRSR
jgi:FkbM family methyltransferase